MIALKEWASVVLALESGIQTLLLRKGGIAEPAGEFHLDHQEFLLYPTYEHQKAELLQPEYRYLIDEAERKRQGHRVKIRSRAKVLETLRLETLADCEQIAGRHIYTDEFLQKRLAYKPEKPLYAIQVKVDALPDPISFTESVEQVGCKSWVEVNTDCLSV